MLNNPRRLWGGRPKARHLRQWRMAVGGLAVCAIMVGGAMFDVGSTRADSPAQDKAVAAALAGGDSSAGRKVFKKSCRKCHRVRDGKHNSFGPNLYGVIGREAGAVEQFDYSEALGGSGIIWTVETLDAWLADPRALVAEAAMKFKLRKPEDRANVIAYLAAAGER